MKSKLWAIGRCAQWTLLIWALTAFVNTSTASEIESCSIRKVPKFNSVSYEVHKPDSASPFFSSVEYARAADVGSVSELEALEDTSVRNVSSAAAEASAKDDTAETRSAIVEFEDVMVCQIRTLHSDLDLANLTRTGNAGLVVSGSGSSSSSEIVKLRLECNDMLFFESFLADGQLSSFKKLQHFEIDKCKLVRLTPDTFTGLESLRSLRINTGNSDWAPRSLRFDAGSFRAIGKTVEKIDLSENNIRAMPENFMCEVRRCQYLNLTRNFLSGINDLLGSGGDSGVKNAGKACQTDVRLLDLSFNNLQSLKSGGGGWKLSHVMKRLEVLRLNGNALQELDAEVFNGLEELTSVNVSSNGLASLSGDVFQSCRRLRELVLRNNSLSDLSPTLFQSLEYLQVLDLSWNVLSGTTLSDGVFNSLYRLVILDVSHNALERVTAEAFKDLGSLQSLDLSHNSLTVIEDGAFVRCKNLHELNLSHNKLKSLSSWTLNGLGVLRKLSLDDNQIRVVSPDAFVNTTSLHDLGLANNRLEGVPYGLRWLRQLKTLDMGENRISRLSNESWYGLQSLYGLRLAGNALDSVPIGFCQFLHKLQALNLAGNAISKISMPAFRSCPDLRILRLDGNELNMLPPMLPGELPNLLWLNVSRNGIQWLDYGWLPKRLEWLDVSHNRLESLWGAAAAAVEPQPEDAQARMFWMDSNGGGGSSGNKFGLRVLDASFNNLTEIDQRVVGKRLEVLKLGHNRIRSVAADSFFANGERLRRVELNNNLLRSISLKAIRLPHHHHHHHQHKQLVELFLAGNPFLCDCEMEWLTRINGLSTFKTHPFVVDMGDINCELLFGRGSRHSDLGHQVRVETASTSTSAAATSKVVKPLIDMNPQDFLCSYTTHCFTLCHCCEFDACDCQMTCPQGCDCYHDDNWSANVVNCAAGSSNHTQLPAQLPMDSTQIYLDGTAIRELKPHGFIGRKNLRMLFLNNTGLEVIANKSFNGLTSLHYLHLEDNKLTELQGFEFDHLTRLKELYLHNNQLNFIANNTFLALKSLEILTLGGNQLLRFAVFQLTLNRNLVGVTLGGNPWDCDCEWIGAVLHPWVEGNLNRVLDPGRVHCKSATVKDHGFPVLMSNETCSSGFWSLQSLLKLGQEEPMWVYGAVAGFISCGLLILLWVCWARVKYGLYVCCCGLRFCRNGRRNSKGLEEKTRDAYLVYSRLDEEFVRKILVDELEDNCGYKLVLHYRDCCVLPSDEEIDQTGASWEAKTMEAGLKTSRKLVLVISANFLRNEWRDPNFRQVFLRTVTAAADSKTSKTEISSISEAARKSKRLSKAILILRDESGDFVTMDKWKSNWDAQADLIQFLSSKPLRSRTVKWSRDSNKFWRKLKFLMESPMHTFDQDLSGFTFKSTATTAAGQSLSPSTSSCNTSYLYMPPQNPHQPHYASIPAVFQGLQNPAVSGSTGALSMPQPLYASPMQQQQTLARFYETSAAATATGKRHPSELFNAKILGGDTLPSPATVRMIQKQQRHLQSINNNDYTVRQHSANPGLAQPWAYAAIPVVRPVGGGSPLTQRRPAANHEANGRAAQLYQEMLRNFKPDQQAYLPGRPQYCTVGPRRVDHRNSAAGVTSQNVTAQSMEALVADGSSSVSSYYYSRNSSPPNTTDSTNSTLVDSDTAAKSAGESPALEPIAAKYNAGGGGGGRSRKRPKPHQSSDRYKAKSGSAVAGNNSRGRRDYYGSDSEADREEEEDDDDDSGDLHAANDHPNHHHHHQPASSKGVNPPGKSANRRTKPSGDTDPAPGYYYYKTTGVNDNGVDPDPEHVYLTLDTPSPSDKHLINDNELEQGQTEAEVWKSCLSKSSNGYQGAIPRTENCYNGQGDGGSNRSSSFKTHNQRRRIVGPGESVRAPESAVPEDLEGMQTFLV